MPYRNRIEGTERGLWGVGTEPSFAIGQRSLLLRTDGGNVLWDSISYLDDETVTRVEALGGIDAISASHPHFYGSVVEWSHAFDNAPIYLPAADRQWVMRDDASYVYYDDQVEPVPGVTILRCGGHFDGSAVLHWPDGADGKGALLVGDTIQVVMDRRAVSIMRSYPNLIPLDDVTISRIEDRLANLDYDRIYGGWWGKNVESDAATVLASSLARYRRFAGWET